MSVESLLVAIIPVFLIGLFIYKHDGKKESSKLLVKLFVAGISSCFPAVFLGLIIGTFFPSEETMNFFQMFLYVFISVAMVEELCKWFFVYKISYNHSEFDSLYDMIVYASFVALGFACLENILYVSSYGITTGIVRAISAVPGHVCDGIFMGSYLALAKINQISGNIKLSKRFKILSLVVPIIIHGIYDFCLFFGNLIFIGLFMIFVITIFIICFKKVKQISKNNIKFKYTNNYCVNCGLPVTSRFCDRCGEENK